MTCPRCGQPTALGADVCTACGQQLSPPPPPPPLAAAPRAPAGVDAGTAIAGARLWVERAPFLTAAALALVAVVLGFTSLGSNPDWTLLVPIVLLGALTAAAELRDTGRLTVPQWPLSTTQQFIAEVLFTLLLVAATVMVIGVALGPIVWLLAAAAAVWGMLQRLRASSIAALLAPAQAARGARCLLLVGGAVAVVSFILNWGEVPGYYGMGLGIDCLSGTCVSGVAPDASYYGAYDYAGRSTSFAQWMVVLLLLALVAIMLRREAIDRRISFVPAVAAALLTGWTIWLVTLTGLGSDVKLIGFWVFAAALLVVDVGAAMLALGRDNDTWGLPLLRGQLNRVRGGGGPPAT